MAFCGQFSSAGLETVSIGRSCRYEHRRIIVNTGEEFRRARRMSYISSRVTFGVHKGRPTRIGVSVASFRAWWNYGKILQLKSRICCGSNEPGKDLTGSALVASFTQEP